MKKVIASAGLLILVLTCISFSQGSAKDPSSLLSAVKSSFPPADSTNDEDILDLVKKVNGEGMAKPPSEFRKGHVSPTNKHSSVELTETGFIIQLPSANGVPSPTFEDGKLYASGGFGSKQYFCFDAITGKELWGMDLDDDGPSSGVIEDNVLIFNTESCTIFACDKTTGEQLWSFFLGDPLMSTPTISDGVVYTAFPAGSSIGSSFGNSINNAQQSAHQSTSGPSVEGFKATHGLIALDIKTGDIKWEKWIDGDIITAPVVNNDELHLVSFVGTHFVLDKKTGEFLKAQRIRGTSAPTFSNERLNISRRSDNIQNANQISESISIQDKDGRWFSSYERKQADYLDHKVQSTSQYKASSSSDDAGNGFGGGAPASSGAHEAMMNVGQSNVSSLQAFTGSRTYSENGWNYNTMGDSLVCSNATNGNLKWKIGLGKDLKRIGGFLGTAPIKVGKNILVATYNGDLLLIDPETGETVKKFSTNQTIRTAPIAMNGWIYVGTTNGKIIGINTQDKDITGWPMLGKDAAHSNGGA